MAHYENGWYVEQRFKMIILFTLKKEESSREMKVKFFNVTVRHSSIVCNGNLIVLICAFDYSGIL
jgi:hypothetical protein